MLLAAFSLSVEKVVWVVAASICLTGSLGVVALRNPVHNALSLVATLFGVAVLFVIEQAYFLAVIQVIVYGGAIVVLFLFVIMLLGVDRYEPDVGDRRAWFRPAAAAAGVAIGAMVMTAALVGTAKVTGVQSSLAALRPDDDIRVLGRALFTDYIFAFEITAVLLTIAVVGAVVLVRKSGPPIDLDEFPIIEDEIDDEPEPEPGDEVDESGEPAQPAEDAEDAEMETVP